MSQPVETAEGWSSNLVMPTDDDGFFGRECPDPACLRYHKLHPDDYEIARENQRLTCPACGATESDEHFHTQEQLARIRAGVEAIARGAIGSVLGHLARRPSARSRSGVVVRYRKPSRQHFPRTLPTYVERGTVRTFICPNGGHRAVVYDLLAFCPYCGPDETPPRAVFDDNIAAMGQLLDVLESLPAAERAALEAAGGATTLVERALTGVVAGLQTLAKHLYVRGAGPEIRGNPWQNLARLSRAWRDGFGVDPTDGLGPDVLQTLQLGFARRHVIEHNGGVIDETYAREASEGGVGRRLQVDRSFVVAFIDAGTQLADRLVAPGDPNRPS